MNTEQVEELVRTGKPQTFLPLCSFEGCGEYATWWMWPPGWVERSTSSCDSHISNVMHHKGWEGVRMRRADA